MKRLLKTVLFMAVLCLAGCSNEDSHVAFSIHEIYSPNDATEYIVGISANCPWLISDDNFHTYTDIRTGEGDTEVRMVVFCNSTTEEQTYEVTIQSRDGTSSDILTIRQEALKNTQTDKTVSLPAEGGEFELDLLSNDNMKNIELPEWMSFVSSRAFSKYVYTFKAEPNKTGKERIGKIHLYGEDSYATTLVTQSPYTPTGIEIENIEDVLLTSQTYTYPIHPVPEYAEVSGLKASMPGGTAYIEGKNLHVRSEKPGTYTLEIRLNETIVYSKELTFISPNVEIEIFEDVFLTTQTYTYPIHPVPEYAEVSGLKASMPGGTAYIEGKNLHVRSEKPGTYTLEIRLNETIVYSKELTFISQEISLNIKDGTEFCIGQPFDITSDIPQEYAEISVSDEAILKKKDGKYVFAKEGTVEVTARNLLSGKETIVSVSSSYIIISDVSVSLIQIDGYSILAYGAIVSMYDAASYIMYTTFAGHDEQKAIKEGTGAGACKTMTVEYHNKVQGYFNKEDVTIHVEFVTTDGRKITRSFSL